MVNFCCFVIVKFTFLVKFVVTFVVIDKLSVNVVITMSNPQLPGPSGLQAVSKFSSPKKKRQKKNPLTAAEKTVIINIYKLVEDTWPKNQFIYKKEIAKKTAETAGVGLTTVYKIIKEYTELKNVREPKSAPPKVRYINTLDDIVLGGIRRKFHEFFFRNEIPTLPKVMAAVNDDDTLPSFKRTTFQKLIKKLNFKYAKRTRQSPLIEKEDIIRWRRKYLQKIMQYRRESRKIYYLDETWLNEGHTKSTVWQDCTIQSAREAHRHGLSTGLKAPSGKGRRLIILHIGNEDGFLDGGELIFESKKGGDYHKEMNAEMFEDWFKKILNKMDPNSVIVMDNAPYHSRRLERIPNMNWTKAQIQNWLTAKGISFQETMVKVDLIDLVKPVKCNYMAYATDTLAEGKNIEVLRLPPYHCELNPIEMIWGQVKGHVAGKNTTFKMSEVKLLLEEALQAITPAAWRNCVAHVIKEEKRMIELENISDNVADQFIISVTDDSTSNESSNSDSETQSEFED